MNKALEKQVVAMAKDENTSLVDVINYLFANDVCEWEIVSLLTSKKFNCKLELIADTFLDDFGISYVCTIYENESGHKILGKRRIWSHN